MKKSIFNGILFFSIISITILNCSDVGDQPLLLKNNLSMVMINLNMPTEDYASNSIIDKILRFISLDAIASSAPASISSVSVKVTGLDIGIIEKTFAGSTGSISLNVPAGNFRQIVVTAYVSASDPSAAASFRGSAVANLMAGEMVTVPIAMSLNETKIVVPDWYNYRIVMIDDISGANWNPKTSYPPTLGSIAPYDIDYDARGRIYIANRNAPGVIRIDDINGTNIITSSASLFGNINNVYTISVDRINNYVYFANTSTLYKANLDGTNNTTLTTSGINTIRGIEVDSSGMLYIAGADESDDMIFKYDPGTEQVIGQYGFGQLNTVWDVISRPPYIYAANFDGAAGYQILQLTCTNNIFSLVDSNGTKTTTDGTGNFFGASRFLAIRNDVIIVADSAQGTGGNDYDKLVSFSNMQFANWATFGSYGTGDSKFKLYSAC